MTKTPPATIVVFEREPFVVPELRRQFPGDEADVRGCRTVRDLDQSVRSIVRGAVVANLGDGAADLLRWLSKQLTSGPLVPTIVVVDKSTQSLEWHAREAGAVAVVSEFIGGHQLARLLRKQWPQQNTAAASVT